MGVVQHHVFLDDVIESNVEGFVVEYGARTASVVRHSGNRGDRCRTLYNC